MEEIESILPVVLYSYNITLPVLKSSSQIFGFAMTVFLPDFKTSEFISIEVLLSTLV